MKPTARPNKENILTPEIIKSYGLDKDVFNDSVIEEKKLKIVKAAVSLFIKNGYLKTTTRQICKKVGMSKGGIYQHIHSKAEILILFEQLVNVLRSEFVKSVNLKLGSMSTLEALSFAIKEYIFFVDRVKDIILFWTREELNLEPKTLRRIIQDDQAFIETISNIVQKGCESGEFHTNDPTMIANNVVILGDQWVLRRWFLQRRYSLEEYVQKQTEFVIKSLK